MNEKQTRAERGCAPIVMALLVVLVLFPLVYVLSIGPVALMMDAGWLSKKCEPVLETAYFPLEWTAQTVPGVESALTSYLLLWVTPTPSEAVYVPTPGTALPAPPPAPAGS